MSESDRRGSARRSANVDIELATSGSLEGPAINVSAGGVLLKSKDYVHVTVRVGDGPKQRGRLVRVAQVHEGTMSYAVVLDEPAT